MRVPLEPGPLAWESEQVNVQKGLSIAREGYLVWFGIKTPLAGGKMQGNFW
jgi:hypothetical protein